MRWRAPLGVSIVCLLMAAFVGSAPWLAGALVTMAALSALIALGSGLRGMLRRDPYDLNALKKLHEREELLDLDPGTVSPDADTVVCLCCGTPRPARIPVCPACKR
jgi:hypothetical protein